MNKKVIEWLEEAPFGDPQAMRLRPKFSYEDWFAEGRSLPKSEETLIELLEEEDLEKPSGNGMRVAYALGWIGDGRARAIDALLRVDASKDTALRSEAVAALGRLEETRVAPTLERLALDAKEDVNVRGNACISLGRISAPSSEPILRRLLNDKDSFVSLCAKEGLKLIRATSGP